MSAMSTIDIRLERIKQLIAEGAQHHSKDAIFHELEWSVDLLELIFRKLDSRPRQAEDAQGENLHD